MNINQNEYAANLKKTWIAFEGTDGVGKSSISTKVYGWLIDRGIPVNHMDEFSNTPLGSMIRDIIQKKTFFMLADDRHIPFAETLVLAADMVMQRELTRSQKNLDASKQGLILSDRGIYSFYVYQGSRLEAAYGNDHDWIGWMENIFAPSIGKPDLTICFTSPMDQIEKRLILRGDNVTQESLDVIEMMQNKFIYFGITNPTSYVVIENKDGEIDNTFQQTQKILTDLVIPLGQG